STFTSWKVEATGQNNFVFGDHQILDLNVASGAGTVSNLQVVAFLPSTTSGIFSLGGSGNVDGFGVFSVTIDDGSGFSAPYTSFTLTFSTGSAVTVGNLLTATGQGAKIAAHMALATNLACTGYAGDGGSSTSTSTDNPSCVVSTPEPNSLV